MLKLETKKDRGPDGVCVVIMLEEPHPLRTIPANNRKAVIRGLVAMVLLRTGLGI
jgi:hypothetical protein